MAIGGALYAEMGGVLCRIGWSLYEALKYKVVVILLTYSLFMIR